MKCAWTRQNPKKRRLTQRVYRQGSRHYLCALYAKIQKYLTFYEPLIYCMYVQYIKGLK